MREDMQELMALHDGELTGGALAKAQDRHGSDAESQELLRSLDRADKAFAKAADEALSLEVPSRLVDTIMKAEPQSKTADVIPFPRRRNIAALAIAAGVAAVAVTSTQFLQLPGNSHVDSAEARYASLLQEALNSVPSGDVSASDDGALSIAPIRSFQTSEDVYCREFMALRGSTESSAIACLNVSGTWEVRGERREGTLNEGDDYRLAAGEGSDTQLSALSEDAATLSYVQEQALINSGWNRSGLGRSQE